MHRPLAIGGARCRPCHRIVRSAQGLAAKFGQCERHEVGDERPAGQALRDAAQQQEVLRTGEHELACGAALVRNYLHIGEEVGHMLGFV